MRRLIPMLLLAILFLVSCADDTTTGQSKVPVDDQSEDPAESTTDTEDTGDTVAAGDTVDTGEAEVGVGFTSPMVIPLSLYILIDGDDPDSVRSSVRTVAEVEAVAANANEIWDQAGIVFDPIAVHRIEAPTQVLAGIATGDTDPFFATVGRDFEVPDAGLINGFYVPEAFGANGFAPFGSRVFFVIDEPTVPDERVTSHEIGHILGLHHDLVDPGRLMFSGTDGTTLDLEETTVARYGAAGILER